MTPDAFAVAIRRGIAGMERGMVIAEFVA